MKNSCKPQVSIIVPSYNHHRYITECIESIVKQTYPQCELIVVDDGSTDSSRRILELLQTRYGFNLVLQDNKGLSATLTEIIRDVAKGKYISICASDDFFEETKIEQQVDFMEMNAEYPACYTKSFHIDEDSNILNRKHYETEESKYRSGEIFNDVFLLKYTLPVTFMYTKELLKEIGYFSSKVYCEDYYTALMILRKYPVGLIDEHLYYYRVHKINAEKAIKIMNSQKEIIESYRNHPLFAEAMKRWEIRRLNELSRYTTFKKECLGALLHKSHFNDIRYWKSWVRMFISWEK